MNIKLENRYTFTFDMGEGSVYNFYIIAASPEEAKELLKIHLVKIFKQIET